MPKGRATKTCKNATAMELSINELMHLVTMTIDKLSSRSRSHFKGVERQVYQYLICHNHGDTDLCNFGMKRPNPTPTKAILIC